MGVMGAVKGYTRPTHGVFRFLPDAWVPYAELVRLDRPSGFWAYYWHYLIGLGFAVNVPPFSHDVDLVSLGRLAGYMAAWVVVFRGITCTWNDNLDQDFDRRVARCRVRPIPRGAVSTMQAHCFTVALMGVGFCILSPCGPLTWIHSAVGAVLLLIYPFLKRCTDFPQVELGFGLSYAIFLAASMVGKDPLAPLLDEGLPFAVRVANVVESSVAQSAACLYVAGILWCVIFDTIYAHQDYLDDLKAGVMGLAVRLGRKGTKPACYIMGTAQVYLLVLAGQLAGFGAAYFGLVCGGTALMLSWMIWVVDLEDAASCAWAFGPGSGYVGVAMASGLMAEFFSKKHMY
ncbi:UbiA prenyltransferase [Apiospora saccharicola]